MKEIIFILLIIIWITMYYLGTKFSFEQIEGKCPNTINWFMIIFVLLIVPIMLFA